MRPLYACFDPDRTTAAHEMEVGLCGHLVRAATCRVQPLSTRLRARAKEYLNGDTVPRSVTGPQTELGFSASSWVFFGPGSVSLGK